MKTIQEILDIQLSAVEFAQYKEKYNLSSSYLDFKTLWESITLEDISYIEPEVISGYNSFSAPYFNTKIDNPTDSDSARYFYLHIGDVRILQCTNPFLPGLSPMFSGDMENIIDKMKNNFLEEDMLKKINEQRLEYVLQRLL